MTTREKIDDMLQRYETIEARGGAKRVAKQHDWFFVKFWGAKVSMHSWRGHALNTVRVLFRCVC